MNASRIVNTLSDLFCHFRRRSHARSDIAFQFSRLLLTGLVGVVITAGCNKSPDAKSSAEPAEITPPGWITPKVTFLGKPGIDLAGPAAVPDGEPDLVLEVTLEPALLQVIATWEVHANDSSQWTSAPNKNGWWLIKTDLDTEQKSKPNRSRIRICFPDNNDSKISKFTLRALQANGLVLFKQTVSK